MVNGNIDKNNTCTSSNEENVKLEDKKDVNVPLSSESTPSSLRRKSFNTEGSSENEDVGDEEGSSASMAGVSKTTFCSVPLNKVRSALNNGSGKIEDEENSSKLKQNSRKLLCLYCDRSFVSSSLRQKHVERCHSEKQSRRLSSRKLQSQFTTTGCFHCDKLPVEHSLRQLFEHLVSEHSQKYFGCLLCEERFMNQLQLNDHNIRQHFSSPKKQQKPNLLNINKEETDGSDETNESSNLSTESDKGKEHQSTKNTVTKKKLTNSSKSPTRQLRNRKKVSVKASKVGLKRSKRLQTAQNKVPVRKKKTKTVETLKSEESSSKSTDKQKNSSVNPYPEFDNYYRVKKITDHSIDNLKISSLTFDDVFDKAFFNRIKCNIQENLLHHLDGKLFKNEESESRISNFEKNPPSQDVSSSSSENFGCDLSLNAVTPVTSILTSNFGEDLESQIEYGSKPSKKKLQIRQDPVRHKYVTRRKYQASILEHKENRDLSKLDMWTQLIIKDRQHKVMSGQKSAKEIQEYTSCTEYKLKIQRNELNRILDRRGPFEDLREEASKKAALENLNLDSNNEINEEYFKEVHSLMQDLLNKVAKNCSDGDDESSDISKLSEKVEFLEKEDIPELPDYLKLRRTSSVPLEEEIDKSDKISLICSSQETENYELPTNRVRCKDEMVELSGEWARSRIYVCAACGVKISNMKLLIDHKSMYHQNSWVQHYELVGNQSELYRHLCIPGLGKVGHVEETVSCKSWLKSESRLCSKCGKVCNSLSELHRHILECGGDWTWMLARKKCKYRPFGARKKRRGLVKRIRVSNQKTDQTEKKKYKKSLDGPRQRPSDADTIQRMLANLPPKRSSRKSICMKDGFPRNRQKSPKNKKQVMKCGKIVRHKSTYHTLPEDIKNPTNHKKSTTRPTLRNISRTLTSTILDTTSKLKVKRQLIQKIHRRSPRKNPQNVSETDDQSSKEQTMKKSQNHPRKTMKTKDHNKMKCVLKDKVNIKNFFPISKRKTSRNSTKPTESQDTDSSASNLNIQDNDNSDIAKKKATKTVLEKIKSSFNFNKKVNSNSKNNDAGRNVEPIVILEKLSQNDEKERQRTSKKPPSKRKLRSSFRKVIDKVKKLKLDNTSSIPTETNNETNTKSAISFLGKGTREKEKLATVLVPLVEESKEKQASNVAFVQNAIDNNSPTEESLIPENIFNLQHNSEDLLQAKSPLESLMNDVKTSETIQYLSTVSAKVSNITEPTNEGNKQIDEATKTEELSLLIRESLIKCTKGNIDAATDIKRIDEPLESKEMSLLSIETPAKSEKSPLISPMLSPSMLSPRMKGKIRKPNRGLNDCIAMLTKKAFEETHKTEAISDTFQTSQSHLGNTNEAHKIIRTNECILKIPVIESTSQVQSEVLDLSKPKQIDNSTQNNVFESTILKQTPFWNPIGEICTNQTSIDNSKIHWLKSNTDKQIPVINPCTEKAILKIPKFVEMTKTNNVDNIIQGVIENYDEPVDKIDTMKPFLRVPSVGFMNSVDLVIEEVVKGHFTNSFPIPIATEKTKFSINIKDSIISDNDVSTNKSPKPKKSGKKNRLSNSPNDIPVVSSCAIQDMKKDLIELEQPPNHQLEKPDVSVTVSVFPNVCSEGESILEKAEKIDIASRIIEPSNTFKKINTSEEQLPLNKPDGLTNDRGIKTSDELISIDSKIVTENSSCVSSQPISVNHISKKKIGETRRRITKRASRKVNGKIGIEPKQEKTREKCIELTSNDLIPTLIPADELDILEEKQISADNIVSEYSAIPVIPFNNSKNSLQSVNSDESSEPHEIEVKSFVNKDLCDDTLVTTKKQNNAEHIETNPNVNKNSKSKELEKIDTFASEDNEVDFKAALTDSEDELPLVILKNRKKDDLTEVVDTVPMKNETTTFKPLEDGSHDETCCNDKQKCTQEKIKDLTDKYDENITDIPVEEKIPVDTKTLVEICEKVDLGTPQTTVDENSANLTNEKPSCENLELRVLDSSPNREHGNVGSTKCNIRRKSPRKGSNSSKPKEEKNQLNIVSRNRVKKSSEFVDEVEKTSSIHALENFSNEGCQNLSENEKTREFSVEKSRVSKSITNTITIDTHKKPKNFLANTSLSSFKDNIKNSSLFSFKTSKHKKKEKNKHDSIKSKLIMKFPKIILKEPVLRIPPRDFQEGANFENSQEKGIKLILDNPFATIKEEDKILPITNIPIVADKSTDDGISNKIIKKKSSKHKKKSSKTSASDNKNEVIPDGNPDDIHIPSHANESVQNECVEEIFPVFSPEVPDVSQNSTNSTDKNDKFSKIKLPIKIKLPTNSSKKCGLKNFKKKKDKSRKDAVSLGNDLVVEKYENEIAPLGGENTPIIALLPVRSEETKTLSSINKIENVEEHFPITEKETSEEFALISNKPEDESGNIDSFTFGETSSTESQSDIGTKIENEENIPVKVGRSLRSTVKITYKQSNIFALQIEDKEISDLKIIEKPKIPLPTDVPSEDMLIRDNNEKPVTSENSSNLPSEENITALEMPDFDSFKDDLNKASDDKRSFDEKHNIGIAQPILEIHNSNKILCENAIKELNPLPPRNTSNEHDEESLKPATKSKKKKRTSKNKKDSQKISSIKSPINSDMSDSFEIICKKKIDELIENTSKDDCVTQDQFSKNNLTEMVIEQKFSSLCKLPFEVNQDKSSENHLSSERDEYSSFSEGELVINESFENQETGVLEELSNNEEVIETSAMKINNYSQEMAEQDDQAKNMKKKNTESKTILGIGNSSLEKKECMNSLEISSFASNDSLNSKGQKSLLNISKNSNSINCSFESVKEVETKEKDEFEFEEEMVPICNLSSLFKSTKEKEANYLNNVISSTSICEETLASSNSIPNSSEANSQINVLTSNTPRMQRSAKSKALKNINLTEKKTDQSLNITNNHIEKPIQTPTSKKRSVKRKESMVVNDELQNEIKEMTKDDDLCRRIDKLNNRRCRAAKFRAIQNIKVLETKANEIEEIPESSCIVQNEKQKVNKKSSNNYEILIGEQERDLNNENNTEGGTDEITLSMISSSLGVESSELNEAHPSNADDNVSEMTSTNNDETSNKIISSISDTMKNSKVNLQEENSLISKSSSSEYEMLRMDEEKSTKTKTNKEVKLEANCESGIVSSEIYNNSFIQLSSSEKELGEFHKASASGESFDALEKIDDNIDCYDISKIDEDNLGIIEPIPSSSPSKKIIKSKKKILKAEIENIPKPSSTSTTKPRTTETNFPKYINTSQQGEFNECDRFDSLDVTLKTTVDEISSILMDSMDKPEIISASTKNYYEETTEPQKKKSDCARKNRSGKKHKNEKKQPLSRLPGEAEVSKRKRNRDSSSENLIIEEQTMSTVEMKSTLEMNSENKRRSKRACKVNTYNENELAEAIFEKAASGKEKAKKKNSDEIIADSFTSSTTHNFNSSEMSPEKKLNSEELFDLLKATAPDNLIALKPVEESPSTTPVTDDNFDDQFDDILRKSQALFGEKPYEKMDICRSDDSSSTSKFSDNEKSGENIEFGDFLRKSSECYIGDTNSVSNSTSLIQLNKFQDTLTLQPDDLYCDICKKSFKRIDNLIKHKTTLTHIAKLSEIETKEAMKKLSEEGQSNEESTSSNVTSDAIRNDTGGYSFPNSTGNDALKIAEIITEALEKPAVQADRGFSEVINSMPKYRRCKSLGERKSFEFDQEKANISENMDINNFEPNIPKSTGVILEKQITLLQNIVGFDCANDASTSSYRSLGNSIASPISDISHKLEDSTNLVFPLDSDGPTREAQKIDAFVKPQIEDISEDSVNQRITEDVKARKVLNRDEELFLECCSLLKSGSEVSNFSKKSNKHSFLNNTCIKMAEERDVLESKKVIYKVAEDSSDYSRRATPLGDSFGDTSNSNIISYGWEMKTKEQYPTQENVFNFGDNTTKQLESDPISFDSSKPRSSEDSDAKILTNQRLPSTDVKLFRKKKKSFKRFPNMRTKGAMKVFEGIKVSIQTSESKLFSLKQNLSLKKQEEISSEKSPSNDIFTSPKTPRRKSKPMKNKQVVDERFIFKVNKKSPSKDCEETLLSKESLTDKVSDIYDFEETQDNTDIFAKPDFKSFRSKGVEATKIENSMDINYEAQTFSSSSSSNLSAKKSKTNECITKKKHMIMGRIFKNAVKPKLDGEIRDIPSMDHNELVENYVLSCNPKHQEDEFKKPKMTEEEMNYLFDTLLDKSVESPKKVCGSNKTDPKNNGMKKKTKLKSKKRQRSNSDSTDDEFGLNKIVKKRPSRKNAKEEDNSINLEQELKECIGVASRKSQRKCTSGKQNVLVEYWSSDESAFETFLENHLQELSEKSELPITKEGEDKPKITEAKVCQVSEENPPKIPMCDKNRKPKSKPKVSPKRRGNKELTSSNELSETLTQSNRRKRTAAHPLYHWSSSSEDELQDLIEIKSLRDDPEDEYDEERPVQHGWIVGDSPKKLVTMLAQAKGKKTESESLVKEQGKKKSSNS